MAFDIHYLDKVDYETEGEEALSAYLNDLVEQFCQSTEGKSLMEANPDREIGFWVAQLIYFGNMYEGVTIPNMMASTVEVLVTKLFPRKISLSSAEDAECAIPELISFWQFLQREYKLPNSDEVLEMLHQVSPNFNEIMLDSSKFGIAKSFFMQGQSAGYDMSNEADIHRFAAAYNSSIAANASKNSRIKKKKARKAAESSRRKNRKK